MPYAARASRAHRLDLALVDLLDRLVEQLGAEADRAQPDRQDAGEYARPDDRHKHQRPDQRVDRARRDDDEQRRWPDKRHARRGVARSTIGHRHRQHDPHQGTQRRHVDGVPQGSNRR